MRILLTPIGQEIFKTLNDEHETLVKTKREERQKSLETEREIKKGTYITRLKHWGEMIHIC